MLENKSALLFKSFVVLASFVFSVHAQADKITDLERVTVVADGGCPDNAICGSANIEAFFQSFSMARQEYAYGGGGDNPVQKIVEDLEESKEEEECRRNTLTAEEVAADQAGHEFPVLRAFPRGVPLPSNWDPASTQDQADYIEAIGDLPVRSRSSQIAAMKNPAADAKLPGECGK